jgi:hypothetical protein
LVTVFQSIVPLSPLSYPATVAAITIVSGVAIVAAVTAVAAIPVGSAHLALSATSNLEPLAIVVDVTALNVLGIGFALGIGITSVDIVDIPINSFTVGTGLAIIDPIRSLAEFSSITVEIRSMGRWSSWQRHRRPIDAGVGAIGEKLSPINLTVGQRLSAS